MQTAEEEKLLAETVDAVAEWGFPVGRKEVQLMVRYLMQSKGRDVGQGPGDDWFRGFCKRNKMSKRAASNMKRARSSVCVEDIDRFFDEV